MDLATLLSRPRTRVIAGCVLIAAAIVLAVVARTSDACACTDGARVERPGASVAPLPAPSSGSTASPQPSHLDPVAVEEVTPDPPVPLTGETGFGDEVTLRIAEVESVQGVARGPGEIAGPAVRLTLLLSNGSASPIPLDAMVVAVTSGPDQTPAATLSGPGGRPFGGELAPGSSATGVYVYAVPEAQRDRIRVTVSSTPDAPVVVFQGGAR